MQLQGRNLSEGMRGEDVALLHTELAQLRAAGLLDAEIDPDEVSSQLFGPTTHEAVVQFQEQHGPEPNGVVEEETARRINEEVDAIGNAPVRYVVRGQVRLDGRPYAGGLVRAFDRDMRSEELLGETTTDAGGRYEITYTAGQFARAEKGNADLLVRVFDAAGREAASSGILFNAGPVETVDLVTKADGRAPSEYERYIAELSPVTQSVPQAELTNDDRAFLQGETGIDAQHLIFLTVAAQHAQQIDVPPELFYGFFRQGLPLSLSGLLAAGPRARHRALEASLQENIVPAELGDDLDTLLESLQQALLTHAFEPSPDGRRSPVADLLETTALPRGTQETFVDLYLKHEGPIEAFWQVLCDHPDFQEDGRVDDIQLTLQTGLLTQGNPSLVRALKARQDGAMTSLGDLAKLEEAEWKELIDSLADGDEEGIPPHVPGETREERRGYYAHSIVETLKAAFPTTFVGLGLAREPGLDEDPVRQGLVRFFENAPDFELAGTHIDTYLNEHETALEGITEADRPAVIDRLKATQRLFRVAPRYEYLRALMQEGLDSAYAVASYPKQAFVRRFGETLGGEKKAEAYYTRALQITATNTNAYASIYQELHDVLPFAIGGSREQRQRVEAVNQAADWPSLFGRIDLCDCEHCRSLYSPAAYFVDLLEFLGKSLPSNGKTPLDVLLARRPDLEHIKLTCENTNTPLPYVDLVNEILEYCVAYDKLEKEAAHDTEDITVEELSVNPQHTIDAAYDKLRDAVYPLTLPFNRPLEVVRAYLEHLGSSRSQVMETFQADDVDVAGESLRLSSQERGILTGSTVTPLYAFYGYAESEAAGWQEDIAAVPVFLSRTGLSYVDLLALLETRFVNPNETIVITLAAPDENEPGPVDACDLSNLKLDGLDDAALSRIHRFIRLRRKLAWAIPDLDKTLAALGVTQVDDYTDIDDDVVQRLAQVARLHEELNVPLVPLLSLWADIDTFGEDALYPQLFLNKAVLNPVDEAFALNEAGTELANLGETIVAHIPAILAVLRIGETELYVVREALGLAGENAALTLANLSAFYRHGLLAKSLKLRAGDLVALKTLSGIDPFQAGNPAPTVAFVQVVDRVRASAFSVGALNYLYRHLTEPARPLGPTQEEMYQVAQQLKTALQQIAEETAPAPDPTGERTREKLGLLWEETAVEPFMALLHGSTTYSAPLPTLPESVIFPEALLSKISYDTEAQVLRFTGGAMALDEKTTLLNLSSDPAYQAAVTALFEEPRAFLAALVANPDVDTAFLELSDATDKLLDHPPPTTEEKVAYILAHLLPYLRDTISRGLIVQTLSTGLDLDPAMTRLLLDGVLKAQSDPAQPAMADFLPFDAESFPTSYRRLHKVSLLVGGFTLRPEEVDYLHTHATDFAGLDFNALPTARTDPGQTDANAVPLFQQWTRLYDFVALRDRLPGREVDLIDLFDAASTSAEPNALSAAVVDAVIEATGWEQAELAYLTGPAGFNLTDADFKNEESLLRLREGLKLSRRVGISAGKLFVWAQQAPDPDQAADVVQTVKARYEDAQWLTVAKPLNDGLRERGRLALVAYVLADKELADQGITTSNQLFEHFLIDVEMDPCMKSSRIKQANSSVQLFVQRCLMNLEPQVLPEAIDDEQWKWMKNYRVWEANRKVFLYPENWIEPELRDDKSPFFKELESELLQDDVTLESAERAFLRYLEKLDDVARLDIGGMYWEQEDEGRYQPMEEMNGILHVFGRTFAPPHIYYYRRLHTDLGLWTPWERVGLDIQGDKEGGGVHLIPVVYNRRLYLFWPIFTEETDFEENSALPEGRSQVRYWNVQLAYSEYRQNRWMPKKTSPQAVKLRIGPSNDELSAFTFSVSYSNDSLTIYVHVIGSHGTATNVTTVAGRFTMDCSGKMEVATSTPDTRIDFLSPHHSSMEYMLFKQRFDEIAQFILPQEVLPQNELANPWAGVPAVLETTPSPFYILHPHQLDYAPAYSLGGTGDLQGHSVYIFFYQDDQRAYTVVPRRDTRKLVASLVSKDSVALQTTAYRSEKLSQTLFPSPVLSPIPFQPASVPGSTGNPSPARIATGQAPFVLPPVTARSHPSEQGRLIDVGGGNLPPYIYETAVLRATSLKFDTFFHPHVCAWMKTLNERGIPGLFTLYNQRLGEDSGQTFQNSYDPTSKVHPAHPQEDVDFAQNGAYSLYNWELFCHAHLLIADRLRQNQRFEEAQQWFHYVFNPLASSKDPAPQRYWNVLPFYENADPEGQQIQKLLLALNAGDEDLEHQVAQWRANPFNPHLIARMRITAYQKTVVMKYIDNLIAWADQLFRRDTIESINEATQLYVLAANLLGPRPEHIPAAGTAQPETYASLKGKQLDAFSNALVEMETAFPYSSESPNGTSSGAESLNLGKTFYFCIPRNDKLLGYWDTVEDRLFKIRHCMNIEGVVRELPLFEPPIDPGLLVKAFAMGVDISSVLSDLHAPLPLYRFNFMLQKALELCAEVKALGNALSSALEKKDAEEMASLRATLEVNLLEAVKEVKKQQIEEAKHTIEGLREARKVTETRQKFYRERVEQEGKKRIPSERNQVTEMSVAQGLYREGYADEEFASEITTYMPDFALGYSGTGPHSTATLGRANVIAYYQGRSRKKSFEASEHTYNANLASILGGWQRRDDDWKLQLDLSTVELTQIDKQIAAAEIREAIARLELDNHEKQIEHARSVEEFLRDKYTNQELYNWMVDQLSSVYFQSYKLAYDIARRAERAFRFERGLTDSSFIRFGYWDSLKKGLLTGEKLHFDLKRMEMAYLEQNRREYEITRQLSLVLHDPLALITLKETGQCIVDLPEALFDMDYPGHYMRRIKSVSLTIPCVTGPYTSVNCTLTLLKNKIRIDSNAQQDYAEQEEDERFLTNFAAIQSIATSHARNDTGLFELNFRDERYLPFEGAGVVSRWRIEMPKECNAFDFDTISDVILTISYTAREGGALLRKKALQAAMLPAPPQQPVTGAAAASLPDQQNLRRLFSARHEFSSEWHRFLHPKDSDTKHTLTLDLTAERFPHQFRLRLKQMTRVDLYVALAEGTLPEDVQGLTLSLVPPSSPNVDDGLKTVPTFLDGMPHATFDVESEVRGYGAWTLEIASDDIGALDPGLRTSVEVDGELIHHLKPTVLEDVVLIYHYVA